MVNSLKRHLGVLRKWKTGISVLAIGGDKLSRGLTLEGLSVATFTCLKNVRHSHANGTLFGYRSGYVDLCRLFTSSELQRMVQTHYNGKVKIYERMTQCECKKLHQKNMLWKYVLIQPITNYKNTAITKMQQCR